MRVLVTGAQGRTGEWVVKEFLEAGHQVVATDVVGGKTHPGALFRKADLSDYGATVWAAEGTDAIVHLAAIAGPYAQPNHVVFQNNVVSTYNVLEAAAVLGIRRVVAVSSVTVYGFANAHPALTPAYLPVDESHPKLAEDPYGLSKVVGEETGANFTRRTGMDTVFLRPPWVVWPETYETQFPYRDTWSDFAKRALWGYVDARDVALAARLAVEHPGPLGHKTYLVTAEETFATVPSMELVGAVWPHVEVDEAKLEGFRPVWDISKLKSELGYEARHSWRAYVNAPRRPS